MDFKVNPPDGVLKGSTRGSAAERGIIHAARILSAPNTMTKTDTCFWSMASHIYNKIHQA